MLLPLLSNTTTIILWLVVIIVVEQANTNQQRSTADGIVMSLMLLSNIKAYGKAMVLQLPRKKAYGKVMLGMLLSLLLSKHGICMDKLCS